jgi:hypothetical protein
MALNSIAATSQNIGGLRMAETIIKGNGVTSLGSIDEKSDLEPKPGFNINPPPADGRCDCCKRHISELEPFGGPGDPLVGDFNGACLVKTLRPTGPYDEEAVTAMDEAQEKSKDPLGWLVDKYGKEKGEKLGLIAMAWGQVGSSWECRDCIVLDYDEYFENLQERGITFDPGDYIAIPQHKLRPMETLFEELNKHEKTD